MSGTLQFEDRVAVVTGAGAGLGRSHALEFARRGAKVLVNDLGSSGHGVGQGRETADAVVDEIRAFGGTAVANYESVENGKPIVESAVKHFGRVDILINNAGILRDSSFAKMTDEDWDLVYRVHLQGTYKVTSAAWRYMREQGYGRIVNTASGAGIYGNFGQANYSAAKLGIYGLTRTLAIEGASKNIRVNCIAPVAGSRLTETILPPDVVAALKPELVTPLVVRLCAEDNEENGALFEIGAGWIAKLRWERSTGVAFDPHQSLTAEDIDEAWEHIRDFTNAEHPDSIRDTFAQVFGNLGIDFKM